MGERLQWRDEGGIEGATAFVMLESYTTFAAVELTGCFVYRIRIWVLGWGLFVMSYA